MKPRSLATSLIAVALALTTTVGLSTSASASQSALGCASRCGRRTPSCWTASSSGRTSSAAAGQQDLKTSLADLITQANAELTAGPWSVTDKTALPPAATPTTT